MRDLGVVSFGDGGDGVEECEYCDDGPGDAGVFGERGGGGGGRQGGGDREDGGGGGGVRAQRGLRCRPHLALDHPWLVPSLFLESIKHTSQSHTGF